ILSMVRPGIRGSLVCDFGRFKRNRRIASAIEAFGSLEADANAPVGLVAKGEQEDGVVFGLWRRRPNRRILRRWGGFGLTVRRWWRSDGGEHHNQKKEVRPLGKAQDVPPGSKEDTARRLSRQSL